MTIKRMKSPFGSVPVLFVVLAVFLAMVGLIWAHWYTSLNVEANVNTGNVGIHWTGAWTNDDGVPDDWDVNDDGSDGLFSHWGPGSSPDPADFGDARYDKDVAGCWAGGGGGELYVDIQNGYPSYHCVATAGIENYGSVPIKALPSTWTLERGYHECTWYLNEDLSGDPLPRADDEVGEFVDDDMNGYFSDGDVRVNWDDMGPYMDVAFDGMFDEGTDTRLYDHCVFMGEELAFEEYDGMFAWGHYGDEGFVPEISGFLPGLFGCGEQIDPGVQGNAELGFHVEQAAEQGATYRFSMHQEFVNWNEFDDGWCDGGGPVVEPGEPTDKIKGFGVRYRNFGDPGGTGNEVYLGQGDLGSGDRAEQAVTWAPEQHVTFSYDGEGTLTTQVDGYDPLVRSGIDESCADFMIMSVVARDLDTAVDLNNVVLNGFNLGDFNATAWQWNTWTIFGVDFSEAFQVDADLVISGPVTASNENNKVELLVACSP